MEKLADEQMLLQQKLQDCQYWNKEDYRRSGSLRGCRLCAGQGLIAKPAASGSTALAPCSCSDLADDTAASGFGSATDEANCASQEFANGVRGIVAVLAGWAAAIATFQTLAFSTVLRFVVTAPVGIAAGLTVFGCYSVLARRLRRRRERSWRKVVALAPGAPSLPVEGFTLWLPDRIQQDAGDGKEQVCFYARRCRWSDGNWQQVESRSGSDIVDGVTTTWPVESELVEIAEAWADFSQRLTEMNAAAVEKIAAADEAVRALVQLEPEPAPQIAELLTLPAPIPDDQQSDVPAAKTA